MTTAEDFLRYIDIAKSNQEYVQAVMNIRDEEEELAFKRGIEQKLKEALRTKNIEKEAKEEEDKKKTKKTKTAAAGTITTTTRTTRTHALPPQLPPPQLNPHSDDTSPTARRTPKHTKKTLKRKVLFTDEDGDYYYFYTYRKL